MIVRKYFILFLITISLLVFTSYKKVKRIFIPCGYTKDITIDLERGTYPYLMNYLGSCEQSIEGIRPLVYIVNTIDNNGNLFSSTSFYLTNSITTHNTLGPISVPDCGSFIVNVAVSGLTCFNCCFSPRCTQMAGFQQDRGLPTFSSSLAFSNKRYIHSPQFTFPIFSSCL